ncbi:Anaphase-promoting complex subunit 8 [Entomophthora muscae]|uniref:Anaphase-promoting complex subunit 8 n=1 Tax=Entomophthora muscae TaxID=34485 RepID=A0ACC2TD76_9FUNG|nr:Anaphase-promoting complex subunit 8 [Entomophthora muscae]
MNQASQDRTPSPINKRTREDLSPVALSFDELIEPDHIDPEYEVIAKDRLSATLNENFRHAMGELSDRGLTQSTIWLCEIHSSLEVSGEVTEIQDKKRLKGPVSVYDEYHDVGILQSYHSLKRTERRSNQSPYYHRAKALFDQKEYARAHVFLSKHKDVKSNLLVFLRLYSQLLAGESLSHNPLLDITGVIKAKAPMHTVAYEVIWDELYPLFMEVRNGELGMDPFCLYLLGIAARRLGRLETAQEALLFSIQMFPYNWSAWLELGKCINSRAEYLELLDRLPRCIVWDFFWVHMDSEFNISLDKLDVRIRTLKALFPTSQTVLIQQAMALYHCRNYEASICIFEKIYREDPCLLDYVDIFSNMLSLKKNCPKLTWLATRCVKLDRLRPETCCVVGNYFFAQDNFEKALTFFSKAIQLEGSYQTAWLLAGQCFVELRNLGSALPAFNKATALNPKDYRAWCGLACVYELLGMKKEAILNYSKAIKLNSHDKRIWHCLGDLYFDLKMPCEAVSCYEHCLTEYMGATSIHLRLGEIHENHSICGSPEKSRLKAAFHYRKGIYKLEPNTIYSVQATKALYFLAEFEISRGEYESALKYCNGALESSTFDQPRGRALKKKAKLLMENPPIDQDDEAEVIQEAS